MSAYTKAASFVLDTLWEDESFREFFYDRDAELTDLGPLCQGELSQKVLKSNANLTSVVDALEGRGLVSRDRSGADRRKVRVDLTDLGRQLIGDVPALLPGRCRTILSVSPRRVRRVSRRSTIILKTGS